MTQDNNLVSPESSACLKSGVQNAPALRPSETGDTHLISADQGRLFAAARLSFNAPPSSFHLTGSCAPTPPPVHLVNSDPLDVSFCGLDLRETPFVDVSACT